MSGVILKITNGPTFRVLSPGPAIRLTKRVPIGNQGIPGPNEVTSTTDTSLTGVLVGNGSKVGVLGFTPENVANKATDFSVINNTRYPTTQAVSNFIGGKANISLNNLASTEINEDLLPENDLGINLGSATKRVASVHAEAIKGSDAVTRFDIENVVLNDPSGEKSLDAKLRNTFDEDDLLSIEYGTRRRLFANNGSTVALQWDDPAGPSTITQSPGDSSDKVATTEYVDSAIAALPPPSSAWGDITGTLSAQTDLQTALNAKAPLASPALTGNPTAPTQLSSDNSTKIATTEFVQTHSKILVQTFTTSGTWTKPSWAKTVKVFLRGGSGGGGSGRRGASASTRGGGGSGVAPSIAWMEFNASDLGATETFVVGAGGAGGAAVTTDDTNGNNGASGGVSSFGTTVRLRSPTSAGGIGGTTAGGAGGTAQHVTVSPNSTIQIGGVAGGTTTGSNGTSRTDIVAATASGSGAGIAGANGASAGGAGGGYTTFAIMPVTSGGAAGAAGGGNGGDSVDTGVRFMGIPLGTGAGGGGSAGSAALPGGRGGNGYNTSGVHLGGAGGGGAASLNGNNSGAGGNGSDGIVVVISEG